MNSFGWTIKKLKAFEQNVADLFLAKQIRGPIHLSGGNEKQLIEIFKKIKPEDWVFSTHRNHYHYLLKGGNPDYLLEEIKAGHSMHIFDKSINFFTSAILAGCCAIAVGVAYARKSHVWVFVGDGATDSGHFLEALRFSAAYGLPITFVIENNGLSVETPLAVRWPLEKRFIYNGGSHVLYYEYKRKFPHTGVGTWVSF